MQRACGAALAEPGEEVLSKKQSKLKQMAAEGNPWAVETLARLQAQGHAAGVRGAAMQRRRNADGDLFGEAMLDAEDIRQWTDGPKPAPWRIYRLAQALSNAQ